MANNREYVRVGISDLRVHYNVVPEGEGPPCLFSLGAPGGLGSVPDLALPEDGPESVLLAMMKRLEAKLDRVLGYVERGARGLTYQYQGQVVDIGGGGILFTTVNDHPVGSHLDLCILSAYGDPRPLFAIGKICWVEQSPPGSFPAANAMGVKFMEIDEESREAIIRFVFHVQRRNKQKNDPRSRNGEVAGG